MHQRKQWAWSVVSMAMGVVVLLAFRDAGAADDDEPIIVPKDVRDSVNKIADDLAKGNEVGKDVDSFVKKHPTELKKTMWVFKTREKDGKGGLGVGKPGQYKPDGIERFLIEQGGDKPMHKLDLKASDDDLNRLADLTLAMAEITGAFVPTKAVGKKTPKEWTGSNEDMKKAALQLKAAVKGMDKKKVKDAFLSISASCNRCHTTFRED